MAQWQMTYMRPQDIIVNPQVRKEYDPKNQEGLTIPQYAIVVHRYSYFGLRHVPPFCTPRQWV